MLQKKLDDEGTVITTLLKGRTVRRVLRHRVGELLIDFEDGTRLFINFGEKDLEFSVTEASIGVERPS